MCASRTKNDKLNRIKTCKIYMGETIQRMRNIKKLRKWGNNYFMAKISSVNISFFPNDLPTLF